MKLLPCVEMTGIEPKTQVIGSFLIVEQYMHCRIGSSGDVLYLVVTISGLLVPQFAFDDWF